jgi:hypothetical protein
MKHVLKLVACLHYLLLIITSQATCCINSGKEREEGKKGGRERRDGKREWRERETLDQSN